MITTRVSVESAWTAGSVAAPISAASPASATDAERRLRDPDEEIQLAALSKGETHHRS